MSDNLSLAESGESDKPELATKLELFELGRLNVDPTMSYDVWQELGHTLADMAHSSPWWIGDYLLHGEKAYGEKWAQATALFDVPISTLQGYMYVASRFPYTLRRRNLPWWAHREVAAYLPEHAATELDWVEREEPTRAALRRRLRGETEKQPGGTCRVCGHTMECARCVS